MDPFIFKRLDASGGGDSPDYEPEFFFKLTKCVKDYVQAGLQVNDFYACYWDRCSDLLEAWAPIGNQDTATAFYNGNIDRSSPDYSIHPMTSTEVWTLATFVSQIIAGGKGARKVEPRRDEDEVAAEMINEMLQWNDDQQPTYKQMLLFCIDAICSNRGVQYDHWKPLYEIYHEEVPREDTEAPVTDADQQPTDNPKKTYTRWRKKKKQVGGFNKIELINPIDFIIDPMLPMIRSQEARFMGHRVQIPWIELDRRSKLDVDDWEFVLPETVKKLKTRPSAGGAWTSNTGSGTLSGAVRSRSFYERQRRGNPVGYIGATDAVNKEDGGIVECFCLIIRAAPKSYDIYPDDDEAELIEFLIGPDSNLLSVNVRPNLHDQYPYLIGEGRPNAHYQYSNSWALMISPIQAYVDFLKNKHLEVLSRSTGNLFLYNPTCIDGEMLTDPKKVAQAIPINEIGMTKPLSEILKQVPIVDTTARFNDEMLMWIGQAESTTGAHAYMQGQQSPDAKDVTATEFTGIQQMGTGRVATIARCIAEDQQMQTKRLVMNFQQFMPEEQELRITGDASGEYDPDASLQRYLKVRRDKKEFPEGDERRMMPDIQGQFDVVPQDMSLPGTDARKVAALTKLIESADNPALAPFFDPTVPGNFDLKKILFDAAKASGVPVRNLIISRQKAQENLLAKQQAAGMGVPVQPAPPAEPVPGAPAPELPPEIQSDQPQPAQAI